MNGKTRNIGWLIAAGLLGAALIAPSAAFAGGNHDECDWNQWSTSNRHHPDCDKESASIPAESASIPAESASIPAESASIPAESASIPAESASIPAESASIPAESASIPAESASIPAESASIPAESASIPAESASIPAESASVPVEGESEDPSGSVLAETGTPDEEVTPPSTDSIGSGNTASTSGWQLVLVALAAILATALIITPASRKTRR